MKKKPRQNKDSEYTTAKKIRSQIFKYDLLPQEDCLVIFTKLDSILVEAVGRIIESDYPFADEYIQDLILRVSSGNTQSRNFYEKNDHEDLTKKKTKVLLTSESRFLKVAFNYLRPDLSTKMKKEILFKSRFLRGVLEDVFSFFITHAEKVQAGDTFQLNSLKNYDLDEVLKLYEELLPLWGEYTKEKEKLITPYLRLVYKIAKKSSSSNSQTLNNFQNGYQGLIKAIRQYTPTRFAVFSLVAKSWIKQSILINVKSEVNFIKLPVGVWHTFQKLDKIRKGLAEKALDGEVTDEELAKEAGMDVAKVKRTYEAIKLTKVFSLDVPTTNEEEQGGGANWNKESIESSEDMQHKVELESEFSIVGNLVQDFPDETRLIFGLATGCINLVGDPDFTKEELEKEILMQSLAAHNIEVIL